VRADYHRGADAAFGPEALAEYHDLKERGLLHKYVLHRRSSQAFALNLFAPLGDAGLRAVLTDLGIDNPAKITCTYERSPADDVLREGRPGSAHATQIDVRIDCLDGSGNRIAVLGEVKFTEDGFGECSAFASGANPWRDVCRTPGLFGEQPERCWMLRNHTRNPAMRTRAYADLLADRQVSAPPPVADDGGCWVRRGLSQPMRNLALAEHLISSRQADRVVWALVAPAGHRHAWSQLNEVRQVFPSTAVVEVSGVSAERVARAHPDGGAAMHRRYPVLQFDARPTNDP
jgi:hypothetical protein